MKPLEFLCWQWSSIHDMFCAEQPEGTEMTEMSKRCTYFKTRKTQSWLAAIMLREENRAVGAGGYAIEESATEDGITVLAFIYLDSNCVSPGLVFIRGGEIWATNMAGWIATLLGRKNVTYASSPHKTPAFVAKYVQSLPQPK